MIWAIAAVAALSVLVVFAMAGLMAWRIPQTMCHATALGKAWPALVAIVATVVGSVSTYAVLSLAGAAS